MKHKHSHYSNESPQRFMFVRRYGKFYTHQYNKVLDGTAIEVAGRLTQFVNCAVMTLHLRHAAKNGAKLQKTDFVIGFGLTRSRRHKLNKWCFKDYPVRSIIGDVSR